MVINLHFQFAKKKPKTIALDVGDAKQNDTIWLTEPNRRKIRETYRKVFHRPIEGRVFTFHIGKARPQGNLDRAANGIYSSFTYESRERYRIIIPPGRYKHLWTNGRRARIFRYADGRLGRRIR